jgi:hypothetical protein
MAHASIVMLDIAKHPVVLMNTSIFHVHQLESRQWNNNGRLPTPKSILLSHALNILDNYLAHHPGLVHPSVQ